MNTLRTGRLTLEPLAAAHAPQMFAVLSDPAIYEFENGPPESVDALAHRYRRLETRLSADGSEHWLNWVVRLPSGELAGYVQATVDRDGVALVAYELNSRHWRQGIGREAVTAMMAELARTYGVHTCAAVFKTRNFRSRALLDALGFTPDACAGAPAASCEPDESVLCRRMPGGIG